MGRIGAAAIDAFGLGVRLGRLRLQCPEAGIRPMIKNREVNRFDEDHHARLNDDFYAQRARSRLSFRAQTQIGKIDRAHSLVGLFRDVLSMCGVQGRSGVKRRKIPRRFAYE